MRSGKAVLYRPPTTWLLGFARTRCAGVPLGDLLLGALLALAAVVTTVPLSQPAHPWTEIAGVVTAGSLALRRRAPLAMAVIAALGIVVLAVLPGASTPMWSFVAILLIAFSAGAHLAGRRAPLGGGLLLAAGYVIQFATDPDVTERLFTPPASLDGAAVAVATVPRPWDDSLYAARPVVRCRRAVDAAPDAVELVRERGWA